MFPRCSGRIGAGLLRIGLASIMCAYYLLHAGTLKQIWGAAGQLDYATYAHFAAHSPLALYRYSASTAYVEFVFWASVGVAALYVLGIVPRVTCWLFAITTFAGVDRNPLAIDSGQNLVVLLAFLLCFTDTSLYAMARVRPPRIIPAQIDALAAILDNAARFLITWQMAMVYFWAAFYKLHGPQWRDGTAMYYILHLERFTVFPALSSTLASHETAVAVLTWSTLALQIAFPLLIWKKSIKPYLVFGVILLHVGIAFIMGMVAFSLAMIVADLSMLADDQLAALAAAARSALATLMPRRPRPSEM